RDRPSLRPPLVAFLSSAPRGPPRSTLFPYTTLFRSQVGPEIFAMRAAVVDPLQQRVAVVDLKTGTGPAPFIMGPGLIHGRRQRASHRFEQGLRSDEGPFLR